MNTLAYPLSWPSGWPRTPSNERVNGSFKGTLDLCRRELINEIDMMVKGLQANIVISTNIPLRNDGAPRADARDPADPGVAVYFERKGEKVCFACDQYDRVWKNVRALHRTVEAMRGIERWGSSSLLDRAFTGFIALQEKTEESCWEVLGIPAQRGPGSEGVIIDAWRRVVRNVHPDNQETGDAVKFDQVNRAKDMALQLAKQ